MSTCLSRVVQVVEDKRYYKQMCEEKSKLYQEYEERRLILYCSLFLNQRMMRKRI